jgi:hypothetical protein
MLYHKNSIFAVISPNIRGKLLNERVIKQEAHGPHRSPESPWTILKDFLFQYAFILFGGM